jgi:hypothetical protein
MGRSWAPQACTDAIACPLPECAARRGERCATDRPLHTERWDAWAAIGYRVPRCRVTRALWWLLYAAGAALIVGQIAWWLL